MQSLIEVLRNSFLVLKKEPKLFLPKIFLALLWGSVLLYSMHLLLRIQEINSLDSTELKASLVKELFPGLLLLLFFSFFFFLLDSVINSAYPLMIQDYLNKKKISVFGSIKTVMKNFWKIVLPVIIAFFLSLIVLLPFTVIFSFSFIAKDFILSSIIALVLLVVVFAVTVLFYFIYPVASIERKGFNAVIDSVKKSRKNIKEASFGSFIALILSLISAFIVSFSETQAITFIALIIFILLRIVTSVLATYSMVLNPLLYFKK
jgi:hypothetical protein